MDDAIRAGLGELIRSQQVLALAVVVDQAPYVGQVPFALTPGWESLLVNVSRLARHARGLSDGARFSALLQQPEAEHVDPFQRPRLTLEGDVRRVAPTDPTYEAARSAFLEKLPTGEVTFRLGDFTLYRLDIDRGRYVAGFGSAHTVTPALLAELAAETPG